MHSLFIPASSEPSGHACMSRLVTAAMVKCHCFFGRDGIRLDLSRSSNCICHGREIAYIRHYTDFSLGFHYGKRSGIEKQIVKLLCFSWFREADRFVR